MPITNKIALVTGASSGIGEATAEALAKAGARVIISARTESKLQALQKKLQDNYNADVYLMPLDVCKRQAVEAALNSLPQEWQDIEILVNNAGLALGLESIQDGEPDDWDRMIDTNIKGLLYVSHYVLKGMVERNAGHVVNIGSTSGYSVYAGGAAYCATKFAVRAISEGMKMDVHETDIRVTEINPGMVDTEFSAVRFKGDKSRADSVYKGFDPLSGKDVADTIIYAISAPAHVNVRQMLVMPTAQTANGMVNKKNV
jgi:3-hydroxy acid dehydrogenase/malonic semialdehyde reductase